MREFRDHRAVVGAYDPEEKEEALVRRQDELRDGHLRRRRSVPGAHGIHRDAQGQRERDDRQSGKGQSVPHQVCILPAHPLSVLRVGQIAQGLPAFSAQRREPEGQDHHAVDGDAGEQQHAQPAVVFPERKRDERGRNRGEPVLGRGEQDPVGSLCSRTRRITRSPVGSTT